MQESINQRLSYHNNNFIMSQVCVILLQENALDRNRPLIYADLGIASRKQPMAPPLSSHDRVVYSTVNSSTN